MAKKPTEKKEKAEAANANGAEQTGPMLSVLAQYIKDMSFENPNAPNSLRPREKPPEIQINVNVGANPLSETDFEVELRLEAKAEEGSDLMFNAELVYAGVFRIQGIPEESMGPAVLIECPRLLFPFARQIISEATRNGGFPPLMIDPIDFAQLYQSRMKEEAAKATPQKS
jgi:preprotein translocase subunit SecB